MSEMGGLRSSVGNRPVEIRAVFSRMGVTSGAVTHRSIGTFCQNLLTCFFIPRRLRFTRSGHPRRNYEANQACIRTSAHREVFDAVLADVRQRLDQDHPVIYPRNWYWVSLYLCYTLSECINACNHSPFPDIDHCCTSSAVGSSIAR